MEEESNMASRDLSPAAGDVLERHTPGPGERLYKACEKAFGFRNPWSAGTSETKGKYSRAAAAFVASDPVLDAAPELLAALKAARHALVCCSGVRATDLTAEQVDAHLAAGAKPENLEWTIDNERELALIDAAVAKAEGITP